MQAEQVRELTDVEITARIKELEEERFRLRFRSATEQLEAPLRPRVIRREIARMKTILGERKRSGGSAARGKRSRGART